MDQNFRKRVQKTLHCGELEPDHCPLALTELAVEYFNGLAPYKLGHVDLQSASSITSQETVSPCSVAMSMMYAKRLQRKRSDYLRKISSSDLFIISMMMASKYLYDEGVDEEVFNDEWAENAGIDKEEVNNMELDFLNALEWELFITEGDFDQAMLSIEKRIALAEGLKRGWFSYTDLCLLLADPSMQASMSDVGLEWLKVVLVNSAAYFAGVMVMVGSTVLVANVSLSLASCGLMPMLRPGLHTPAAAPGLAPSALPLPITDRPWAITSHTDPGFSTNETGDAEGIDEGEPRLIPGDMDQSATPSGSIVNTILSQLMAVLTLKSHLAQFVSAVSDGYASGKDRNRSSPKVPQQKGFSCSEPVVNAELEVTENAAVDDVMSHWFELGALSADLDAAAGSCLSCGRSRLCPPLESVVGLPSAGSPHCIRNQCCEGLMANHGLDHNEWLRDPRGRGGVDHYQSHIRREGSCSNEKCWTEAETSMYSLFPDITIGFSTSMLPPVYAT